MAKDMNVCGVDRALRIILSLVLFVLGLVFNYWFLVVIGLYPFFTAMFNYCPINRALHIDSCRLRPRRKDYGAPNYGPSMGPNAGSDF
jgi:hypothetical protein